MTIKEQIEELLKAKQEAIIQSYSVGGNQVQREKISSIVREINRLKSLVREPEDYNLTELEIDLKYKSSGRAYVQFS